MSTNDTAQKLMDTAQDLIQRRGYNAFSFKDLAATVGIRTASIHYHFPTKGDLGVALMANYIDSLRAALAHADRPRRTNTARLKDFIGLYAAAESSGAICLCGSLATDGATLPPELQDLIRDYLSLSERWVADKIRDGIQAGEFDRGVKPTEAATSLLSSLQGGLILSRARDGAPLLAGIQRMFLRSLAEA